MSFLQPMPAKHLEPINSKKSKKRINYIYILIFLLPLPKEKNNL
jgi:hypothetical protein